MDSYKIIRQLKLERDNCPRCNSDKFEVIYKGKKKNRNARYFKKLKCDVCGYEYIAESESEFNERIKDYSK